MQNRIAVALQCNTDDVDLGQRFRDDVEKLRAEELPGKILAVVPNACPLNIRLRSSLATSNR